MIRRLIPAFSIILAVACSSSPGSGIPKDPLVARGEAVYKANCIVCHNANPAKDGSLGPALQGSSRELLEARVVSGIYPPGYQPKRDSKLMPAFPQLKQDLEALAAFLNH